MYRITMEFELKNDMDLKASYEKIAAFVRLFMAHNQKELQKTHYEKTFSYYTFSNFFPRKDKAYFKKGERYSIELRSLKSEFLDLKKYKGLETEDLRLIGVNAGKLYYRGEGYLKTETPVFFNTKRIETETYEKEVKEKIRENILFHYLKSELNTVDDLNVLRNSIIKDIRISKKIITIPFEEKKLKNGKPLLYHCLHVDIWFHDNETAKQVEQVIYAGGLGLNTSNGFGFMRNGGI